MSEWEFVSISSIGEKVNISNIPEWVSLEPLEFQINWQITSGKRPIQPTEEREYYENLWIKNSYFKKELLYKNKNDENNIYVNEYTSLFLREFNGSYAIQITHFKIIKNKYPLFLVKFKTPNYEYSTWNKYSRIQEFYNKIIFNSNPYDFCHSKLSWYTIKKNKRWFKRLDINYLKSICFFLERLLHDLFFESYDIKLFVDYFANLNS